MHCGQPMESANLVQWATDDGRVIGAVVLCAECAADACEYLTVVREVEVGLPAHVRALSSKALHEYVVRRAP